MGRYAIRTEYLHRDKMLAMRDWLVTARNAWVKLRLAEAGIELRTVKRALSFYTIEPRQKAIIEDRWDSWAAFFITDTALIYRYQAMIPREKILPLLESELNLPAHLRMLEANDDASPE
jgi:hypothetical protein